jgi:hypothetical protein
MTEPTTPTKTHWRELLDDRFLGAYSLPNGEDLTVTISHVKNELIDFASGKENKNVAYLEGGHKPLVLNRVNQTTIETLYRTGHIEDWAGLRITLYASTTMLNNELVPCLRIRAKVPPLANPPISDERLAKALAQIAAGAYTMERLRANFTLSAKQEDQLRAPPTRPRARARKRAKP